MTEKQAPRQEKQPDTVDKGKKHYQKPSFRHERVFETLALACGKISSTQGNCRPGNRKTS